METQSGAGLLGVMARWLRAACMRVDTWVALTAAVLLLGVVLPRVQRAKKSQQASWIMDDMRLLEAAVEKYAFESGRPKGTVVPWETVRSYLKPTSTLATTGRNGVGGDYTRLTFTVGRPPSTPVGTAAALGCVAGQDFWEPYRLE